MKILLNDLLSFLCKLIFSISSLSPILALTSDSNYGFNSQKPKEKETYRFSVINLRLGFITYYILTSTFNICDKKCDKIFKCFCFCFSNFMFVYKINLESCQWNRDKDAVSSYNLSHQQINCELKNELYFQTNTQRKRMMARNFNDNQYPYQLEFLLYLINNEQERKNVATVKIGLYAAAMFVILPESFSIISKINSNIFYYILIFLLIYYLLNIVISLFQFIQVSYFYKSSFKDLREAKNQNEQLLLNYYYDWQSQQFSAQQAVVKVNVVQHYFICILVLLVILTASSFFSKTENNEVLLTSDIYLNEVYTINFDELINPFSKDSLQYIKLHTYIVQSKPNYIVVFCNENDNLKVLYEFEKYEKEVRIIVLNDSEQNIGKIKIGIGD